MERLVQGNRPFHKRLDLQRRRNTFSHLQFALLACGLAVAALVGWVIDAPFLTTFVPGRPSMSPMTALMVLLGGGAIAALQHQRRLALTLAAGQAACGALIVVAHHFALPSILWIPHTWWSSRLTGAAFCLYGITTFLLAVQSFLSGQLLAMGTLLLALLLGLGHVIQHSDLYLHMPGTGVAIPTVLAFAALSVSQLMAYRDKGIAGALTSSSMAGKLGRRLLVSGLGTVTLLSVAVVVARRHGLFDADTAVLITGWGATVALGSTLWGLAVAVARAERARRAAELERDRVQQMVAATVTHDLRSPLSAAVMATHWLDRTSTEPGVQDAVKRLQRSHTRLDRLLRSLLDSLAVGGGRPLKLKASRFALQAVIAEVVDENSSALSGRVQLDGAAEGWWDHDALFRVMENLFLNAVKYGDAASLIDCRIRLLGDDCVVVTVHNRGCIIPRDEWDTIFQPFTRGKGVSEGQAGWGVGLAYARTAVMGHGGTIKVTSSDGEGTAFEMRLPLDARPALVST